MVIATRTPVPRVEVRTFVVEGEPQKTTQYRSGARRVLRAWPGGWRGRRRRARRGWGRVVLAQAAGTVTARAREPTLLDPYDRDGGEDEQQPQAGSVPVGIVTGAVGILAESLRPLIDYGYLMLAPSATDKTDPPR